jgi:cysteine desulfurase
MFRPINLISLSKNQKLILNVRVFDRSLSVAKQNEQKEKLDKYQELTKMSKKPLYLDAQATTPVDPRVLDAMLPYMTNMYGNPHSRTHAFGWESEKAVETAREVWLTFILLLIYLVIVIL